MIGSSRSISKIFSTADHAIGILRFFVVVEEEEAAARIRCCEILHHEDCLGFQELD